MSVMTIKEDEFDSIIQNKPFVCIEFSSKHCAPCKIFFKILEELAQEYSEFVFATIDIEEAPTLASEFQIFSVPAVMIFRNKVLVYAGTGLLDRSTMRELLSKTKLLNKDQL